jgi:hypothetical protein
MVARFLSTFALNTENALAEIRRADRERGMSSRGLGEPGRKVTPAS